MTDERYKKKTRLLFGAGLILLATVIAYIPAMKSGYIWDDDAYVTENTNLRDLQGLERTWFEPLSIPQYYPLTHTAFWIEYQLWGLNPTGYHVVNVLLHAAGALLLWFLLSRLGVPGAFLAAAVFALHPVNVESVAWITERKNVLSGLFYLGAFIAYLRFAGVGAGGAGDVNPGMPGGQADRRARKFYFFALVLFVCALLSKSITATLPAAVLLVLWWKRPRLTRRDVLPLIPFFAAGVTMGLMTTWLEKFHVGALGREWDFNILDRLLIAGRVVWFYVGKLLFPHRLTFIYERWTIDPGMWWQYIFPLAAAGVIVLLWLNRRRWGKGPLVAVLFFVGTLFPALGFFDVYPMRYSFVADHFQYLAGIGMIALICGGIVLLLSHVGGLPGWAETGPSREKKRQRSSRSWGVGICVVLLLVLGVSTWLQGYMYKDVETLWRETILRNDKAWIAYLNLGIIYKTRGQVDEGFRLYEKALEINPDSPLVHYNIANALREGGRMTEAIGHYRRVLEINPKHVPTLINLGNAYLAAGQLDEALTCFLDARKIRPNDADVLYSLGGIVYSRGQVEDAARHYRRALQLRPDFAEAHNKLGVVLTAEKQVSEAITHFQAALKINPHFAEAFFNLGVLYHMEGKLDEAVVQYRRALDINPNYPEAHNNLGIALSAQERLAEAVEHFRQALRLKPDFEDARHNLERVEGMLKGR